MVGDVRIYSDQVVVLNPILGHQSGEKVPLIALATDVLKRNMYVRGVQESALRISRVQPMAAVLPQPT